MKNNPLPRLDTHPELRQKLLPYCRLKEGEIWQDPLERHRIGCLDTCHKSHLENLMANEKADLCIQDPPYNLVAFEERSIQEFIQWCKKWLLLCENYLKKNSSLYIWIGADQNDGFQPLPDLMHLMRDLSMFQPRSFITLRNQRGYGTQKNWMAVRQELLYYTKGEPTFLTQYTEIPKILRGYYKEVNGQKTENLERSKSENIRPGNVWVDIQQIFYRMEENVSGCYAQKPLKAIDRIVLASSKQNDLVLDTFGHSGTTLISCERQNRRCFTSDLDPLFAEIMIRRLELFREKRKLGWQNSHPFELELK